VLLPSDVDLVRRERALPGLGTILDSDAVAQALETSGARSARATYVRYKPGGTAIVAYRVDLGEAEVDAYAKAFKRGDSDKCAKLAQNARELPGGGPGVVILPEALVAVAFYPNDHDLGALRHLEDAAALRSLLRETLPGHRGLRRASVAGLRYKPERRYVGRVDVDGKTRAVLKLHERDGFARAVRAARAAKSYGAVQLPAALGTSQRHRAVSYEWLPGTALDRAMRNGLAGGTLEEVGSALAAFHDGAVARPSVLPPEHEAERVLSAARMLGALLPERAPVTRDLASRIVGRLLESSETPLRPVHGDFSADQVLIGSPGVAMVDLDTLRRGDPASDLGSFGAALWRDALAGTISEDAANEWFQELLRGYRKASEEGLHARLSPHVAARLLRLAPEPFRFRAPDWRTRAHRIVERAGEVLAGSEAITC
jgi:aminoglycoside phosphotransferase (APT) family kinase protein